MLGAVSFGSSFAYVGRFLVGRGVQPLMLAGGQLTIAAVLTLFAVPFLGLQAVDSRTDSTIALVVLGVMCTGFAVLLNTIIIAKDGPAAAATVIYLMTVVSVVLGAVFLDESWAGRCCSAPLLYWEPSRCCAADPLRRPRRPLLRPLPRSLPRHPPPLPPGRTDRPHRDTTGPGFPMRLRSGRPRALPYAVTWAGPGYLRGPLHSPLPYAARTAHARRRTAGIKQPTHGQTQGHPHGLRRGADFPGDRGAVHRTRTAHQQYLRSITDRGILIGGGPWEGGRGEILIIEAPDEVSPSSASCGPTPS